MNATAMIFGVTQEVERIHADLLQLKADIERRESHEGANAMTRHERYSNPRNGWHYSFDWSFGDGVVEIRSTGRPAYYMTFAGAVRFAATLDQLA